MIGDNVVKRRGMSIHLIVFTILDALRLKSNKQTFLPFPSFHKLCYPSMLGIYLGGLVPTESLEFSERSSFTNLKLLVQ